MAVVAITGASGMLGRSLVASFCQARHQVVAFSRTRPENLPIGAKWQEWNLCQWLPEDIFGQYLEHASIIVHAGSAIPPHSPNLPYQDLIDANVRSCLNLGLWAKNKGIGFTFISGSNIYSNPAKRSISEDDPLGANDIGGLYAASKLMGEIVLQELAKQGLSLTILRPSSIYGPGMPVDKFIPRTLVRLSKGETIIMSPPVDDFHNMVYAKDVASASLVSMGIKGTFNIGGFSCSLEEIARTCHRVVGSGAIEIEKKPSSRPGIYRFDLDCSKAATAFKYRPLFNIEDGIRQMFADLKARGIIN